MLRHYLSVALRNLLRNKSYTIITVFGLAIGLASVFLIVQYLHTELSYDQFHKGAENIYRITWEDENPQTRTPHPMAQAMVRDFPEVESAVSLTPVWGPGLIRQTFSIRNLQKDIRFDETGVLEVDSTFFKVFSFELEKGDPNTVLKNPAGFLISSSMAKKYFGDEDPIGKHLAVNDDRQLIEVIGVFKDVPRNSHFHFDALVSYVRPKTIKPGDEFFSWSDFGHYNYIKLKPGTDPKLLESRIPEWITKYLNWSAQDISSMKQRGFGFRLQPLTDIHLHSNLHWELESNGNISYIYMVGAAALLILIIACINFINIATAQSSDRAKEIGIRKSLGAYRRQLSFQFIGESLLITAVAVAGAVIIIELALPFYQSLTGSPMEVNDVYFILLLAVLGLVVGILAGVYPAMYLASLKPGLILKGKFISTPRGSAFRSTFMTFQFFASMVLICCSMIIFEQLNFVRHKSLGFSQDAVIVVPVKNRSAINPKFEELQTELLRIPGIKMATASSNVPGRQFNQNPIFTKANPELRINSSEAVIDYDFFKTLDITLSEGRFFSKENPADQEGFVINQSAAKSLFPEGAVGKELVWEREGGSMNGTILGVINDFHFQSLHEPVRPLLFRLSPNYNYVLLKLDTRELDKTIKAVEKTWKKFDDRFGFEFSFLSDQLNQQYSAEQNMATVMIIFATLAAIIACFGLLGIAALTFRNKTKEVSVRKVLGASVTNLTILMIKDFTRMVVIAILLAVPFVWWIMTRWLENFNYRTKIDPWVFGTAGVLLIVITWGTLSYLTLKIVRVNPAETLKSE